ncbi:MAG: PLP-dependent aminotransferase family protein, partial [Coprobacillaceae bacterium]
MKQVYSNRISGVKASAIREILKMMSDPEMISFGGGNPASESFPIKEIATISNKILMDNPLSVLEYGVTEGNIALKSEIINFMLNSNIILKESDDILITSGSQQIMDFVAKVLCNEGDYIICEEPSFLGALNAFKSNGAELIGIPMEADGMNIEKLEVALQNIPKPKCIYTIPNFQNPTGITTSYEKRKKIYDLAEKYDVMILEDNPYGDLRFQAEDIASIKSFDEKGIVIYAQSLSKIIAPGMRVAAMIANKDFIQKCTIAKQVNDVHTNAWAQSVMAEFLKQTDMKSHLMKLQNLYRDKCNLMLTSIQK